MKTTDNQLLKAFERMCEAYGVLSAGFNPENITAPCDGDKHDGKERWAMKHVPEHGWIIVCAWRGCGAPFGVGYIKGRKNFLVMINALWGAAFGLKLKKLRE